jgi:murein DD-endopeptidase MepM/ murein hydrolase activator NlpD/tRNA(Arg) A34 adenosine deaminase TadA
MSKHLAPAAVRRTPQDLRHAVLGRPVLSRAVRIGAGAAFLAVYAFGFQGAGPVLSSGLSSGQVPADMGGDTSINVPLGSATVALAAVASDAEGAVSGTFVSTAGAVSASADAYVSYSRTVVFTAAKPVSQKLHAASSKVRRPAAGTLMAPLEVLTPTSHFGLRTSPITGTAGEFHWGQDFSAACGTRVYAADAGVVRAVGWHPWGGGNRVEIDHGNGLITTYNHLEGIGVKKGQSVQVGQLIARVGTTGSSTGCHLHFETILNGKHTDPDNWTLLRLRHSGPVANIKMTDYRKSGTATETPSWAVPVEASARHAASDEGHESPAVVVSAARSSAAAAASVSTAQPLSWRAAAPAQWVASPKPVTPAPAPRVAAPKPKPAKPVPASRVVAPKPKPAAYQAAQKSLREGGIPIGAALARDGVVIASGHNERVQNDDPIAHGEMSALRAAGRQRSYRDTTLYTTLAPCAMCTGTIIQFKIPRVVVGEARTFDGEFELLRARGVEVVVLDDQRCVDMMRTFQDNNPDLWAEDIAEDIDE